MSVVPESDRQPPDEMLKRAESANVQRLANTEGVMEVYWADRMWKYRIVARKNRNLVLMSHIRPESMAGDDHWIYLAISSIQESYLRGITDGKLNCVERMLNDACATLGVSKDMFIKHLLNERTIG